jgi:hypothetical protein
LEFSIQSEIQQKIKFAKKSMMSKYLIKEFSPEIQEIPSLCMARKVPKK